MSVLFLSRGGWYRGIKGGRDFSILQNKKSERINLAVGRRTGARQKQKQDQYYLWQIWLAFFSI